MRIGIADVDASVPVDSPIDRYASQEATSVYTGVHTFPMLPEALSTDRTSLKPDADRVSLVIEFVVASDGRTSGGMVYRALTRNQAQLTYTRVGGWLDGRGEPPPPVAASPLLRDQLTLQHEAATRLRAARQQRGALTLESTQVRPLLDGDRVTGIAEEEKNLATALIEDFMIAANETVAQMLDAAGVSSIRRVVRAPERWDRIVALAASKGARLPEHPDPKALDAFLGAERAADPDRFLDLSLAVVKLLGPGTYVVQRPGAPASEHFALAVHDYTHATAPNRRFADLVTQRLIKAALRGAAPPYSDAALEAVARNSTVKEDAARKVERDMAKRLAATAMGRRLGETFDAVVTGVTPHGTFVRVFRPHVEGLLERAEGVDVGDRLRVRLVHTDPARGYIDFARA